MDPRDPKELQETEAKWGLEVLKDGKGLQVARE